MDRAAWYSDTRALYILRPIPVQVHVGCPLEMTLRTREASDLYTTVISPVDAAAPARREAAAAAVEAERARKRAGASVAAATAAKVAAGAASAAALAASLERGAADALETSFPLPSGAHLGDASCRHSPPSNSFVASTGIGGCTVVERQIRWTASKLQWGLRLQACFRAKTLSAHTLGLCLDFSVQKCSYCVQAGDTLQSIASDLDTSWLQIWGANVHLQAPFALKPLQLILLGPLLRRTGADTLSSLSARYGSSASLIQQLNPYESWDSTHTSLDALSPSHTLCILPQMCSAKVWE